MNFKIWICAITFVGDKKRYWLFDWSTFLCRN